MRWLLEKYNYKIGNEEGKNNRFANIIDCIFCVVYAVISLFNAFMGINTMAIFDTNNQGDIMSTIRTVLLIVINIIVLLRLNIKLYIKGKETAESALKEFCDADTGLNIPDININTWNKRIQFIKYVYVIDAVIIIMNFIYKSTIETSLSTIVFLPILVTLFNNIIDIAENMYQATPIIDYQYTAEDM